MGSNPRDFGNLAEVLELEPSDRLDEQTRSPHYDPAGYAVGANELQARLAERLRTWNEPQVEPRYNEPQVEPRYYEPAHYEPAPMPAPVEEPMLPPANDMPDDRPEAGAEPAQAPAPSPDKFRKALWWRVVKTLIAVAVVIALGWTPLQRFLQTTSAEATVNARLVTLRAPIHGAVSMPADTTSVGATIDKDAPLLTIEDARADRTQVDTLRRQISGLESERDALTRRKSQLQGLQGQLREQRDAFQKGRVEQLEARVSELTAEIAAATAKEAETKSALERAERLKQNGWQTAAALDKAERDNKVAVNTAEALRQRLTGTKVELDAARTGLFVGDSYNDIPRTAQRLDEVTQQIIDLDGEIDQKTLRISQLNTELAEEEKRFAVRSTARLTAPVNGRVWEVLTSNGEQVSQGQDLMRVLDCGGVVVTAAVSEAVYNALKLGEPATFHLRGESEEHKGRIIGLNGLATVPANLAIEQDALAREPYHVTVEVPSLATGADCHVGRTGKVTFGGGDGGALAALR